ncbi:MAG: hypothetical protein B7Z54_01480 [Sphingobacteriales bacterium 12-47-4]|nr:MAG: hypothetical protein B7Z54_01480 [Sphingobacteriales bacterium 12-47-4]
MKRSLLAFAIIIFSISAKAQIKKGSRYVGAQVSYLSGNYAYNTQEQRSRSATIGAYLGKFTRENQVVGFQFSYTTGKAETLDNGVVLSDNLNRIIEAGVFLRKYKKLAKDFYFYGQGDLAYRGGKQTNQFTNPTSDNKVTQTGGYLSLSAGLSYQVFTHFYFEVGVPNILLLQYTHSNQEVNGVTPSNFKQNEFLFRSSLLSSSGLSTFGIGFRVIW